MPRAALQPVERCRAPRAAYLPRRQGHGAGRRLSRAAALAPDGGPAQALAAAYLADGADGLDRFDGDFAFVLFDRRQHSVIARRDPFGVRPLYWARLPEGGLAFASLPEALPASGLIPKRRDVEGVLNFIKSSAANTPRTFLEGVSRVLPRTHLEFAGPGAAPQSRIYWTPAPQDTGVPKGFDEWTGQLRVLLDQAVRQRIPKAGDLGTSVSSGLDSTSVMMLAERHLGDDQHIFASTYAASSNAAAAYPGRLDETELASGLAAGSNRISWEPLRLPDDMGPVEASIDAVSPTMDPAASPEFRTAPRAAELGADVLLTGWGGDNVVSYKGTGTEAALMRRGQLPALRRLQRSTAPGWRAGAKIFARAVRDLLLPLSHPLRQALMRRKGGARTANIALMTGLKRAHLTGSEARHEHRTHDTCANRIKDILSPILAYRLEALACHGLRHGVRYAHPLLDRRLITFALSCPPEFEVRDGQFRAPIRAAMAGILPDSVRLNTQPALPFVEAYVQLAALKDELLSKLGALEGDARLQELFDFQQIRQGLEALPTMAEAEDSVRRLALDPKRSAASVQPLPECCWGSRIVAAGARRGRALSTRLGHCMSLGC